MEKYLFVTDLSKLRRKFASFSPPLRACWENLQYEAEHGHSFYPAFCYLVTGKIAYAEATKKAIFARLKYCEEMDADPEFQNHLWCQSAHTMRFAIFYDWIYSSGVLTDEEHIYIQNGLTDYVFKHPYQSMQARLPMVSENQQLAMILSSLVVGYVFGVKRAQDILAREIMNEALEKVPDLIDFIPPGGYSGEGSVHVGQAYMPGMSFLCALLEWITGEDWLDKTFSDNQVSIRKVFEFYNFFAAPSGLMVPIDEGYTQHRAKFPYAYFASKTGNGFGLDLIAEQNLWAVSIDVLWADDDKAWTLFWWPEEKKNSKKINWKPWFVEEVAACLVDSRAKNHLIQMWDNCHYPPVRQEAKPNSVLLEAFGIPLLVDSGVGCPELEYSSSVDINRDGGWSNNWGFGSVGSHNCIFIDDEPWYTPKEVLKTNGSSCRGQMQEFFCEENIKLVSSEAVKFYEERYDLDSIVRTTFLLNDSYIVIKDVIKAKSEHKFTWRGYLRGGSSVIKSDSLIVVGPQKSGGVLMPFGAEFETVNFLPDYPKNIPPGSYQASYSKTGKEVIFLTVLHPFEQKQIVEDISDNWIFKKDRNGVAEKEGWQTSRCDDSAWSAVKKSWFYSSVDRVETAWYRRKFFISSEYRNKTLYLNLGKLPKDIKVFFNRFTLSLPDRRGENLPLVIVLPVATVSFDKENLIALEIKHENGLDFSHAVSWGFLKKDLPQLKLSSSQELVLDIENGAEKLSFLYHNPEGKTVAMSGSATKAKYALAYQNKLFTVTDNDAKPKAAKTDYGKHKKTEMFTVTAENITRAEVSELLRNPDYRKRINACYALRYDSLPETEILLLEMLKDKSWQVKIAAIRALGKRRSAKAVAPLLQLLEKENCEKIYAEGEVKLWRLKMWIAFALGEIADKTAVPVLSELLSGNDFYTVRAMSAQALVKINPEVLPEKIANVSASENESNTLYWWRMLVSERGIRQKNLQFAISSFIL